MTTLCLVSCKTMGGDHCVFPFYYNGTQHYDCIEYKDSDTAIKWCAVEVTREGVEEFKWDYCPGNIVLTVQWHFNDIQPLFRRN